MALKLITETTHDIKSLIVEAKDAPGHKAYYIEGIFMQGAVKNQNGRIYPTGVLNKEVQRYTAENIARKRAFGELGHPESPTVNLDRVSHMITEMKQDRDNFIGRAKVMVHTPMGAIVKALIDEGAELGVSSRGLGSLKETSGGMEVQSDYYFSAMDIVADPSAPDAFVRGIMEGKEWVWESGALKERELVEMARIVDSAHGSNVPAAVKQETLVKTFGDFMLALRSGVQSKIN